LEADILNEAADRSQDAIVKFRGDQCPVFPKLRSEGYNF